jgi:hypothetical protein
MIIKKLEKRFNISTDGEGNETYVKRLLPVTIIAGCATTFLSVIFFIREHTLTDYISKLFGTITGLGYDLLDWTLFNFVMIIITLIVISGLLLYTYRGYRPDNYMVMKIRIAFTSILILIIWEIASLGLFYWINSFTIETWFA